jgi:hypothetical protein
MAQAMEMSQESISEYTEKMRGRYGRRTGKRARSKLLDEYVEVTGYERKYANKVLRNQRRRSETKSRRGAPIRYGAELLPVLKTCWQAMEQPCGKRMADMLPLWVDHLQECDAEALSKLLKISPASIDRLLKSSKAGSGRKRLSPRSSSAVKAQVEIRAESWDTQEAGWTEVDTVAHCGGDMGGNFVWSLTSVDIASGWTEVRALWNRGQHAALQGLQEIKESQPFDLKGVDSDNGGEFLNHHVHDWLKLQGIKQTRSRPYRKNDQAHVEQKNYTHVRQFLGYDRLEHPELMPELNELLRTWSLWRNLYCVTMEQTSKRREGCKQIRTHARTNRTPAQRLLDGPSLTPAQRDRLKAEQKAHNPFEMKRRIEKQLARVWRENRRYEEGALVGEGASPLRSEAPSPTNRHQPEIQDVMVSCL